MDLWLELNDMIVSSLPLHVKISFFQASVESVLLYGCESWTLKPTLQKSLDGCSTRMLRVTLNIDQKEHVTNKHLYGGLPRLCDKVASRWMTSS